jgi:hypothetical protein
MRAIAIPAVHSRLPINHHPSSFSDAADTPPAPRCTKAETPRRSTAANPPVPSPLRRIAQQAPPRSRLQPGRLVEDRPPAPPPRLKPTPLRRPFPSIHPTPIDAARENNACARTTDRPGLSCPNISVLTSPPQARCPNIFTPLLGARRGVAPAINPRKPQDVGPKSGL